ncbi:Asp/Glu racemase [Streptomyces albus]|uniref:maleate cis-trans isomerase family protein n=1 Tax=Streptomyces albus TaxID=1888 RepID=UPI0036FD112B
MTDHHIGLIVPSSNLTMETELPRMMRARQEAVPGEGFCFHSSRTRMRQVTPEELRGMNAQTERACLELADARPDVVVSACLVAIMAQGPGHHRTAEEEMRTGLAAGGCRAPVVSSAGALLSGIAALGVERVALITPYTRPLTATVVRYLEEAGVTVVDALSLEVPDNLAVARLDPDDLRRHWRRLALRDAQAIVLSACVQMPSLPAVQDVEDASGLPVLTAATATAHRMLTELGLAPVVPDAGALLSSAAA